MSLDRALPADLAAEPILFDPIHPGEILQTEFMEPYGLSSRKLAASLNIPSNRISDIVRGHRRITADTALRLARFFGNSPTFWLPLQEHYDLEVAAQDFSAESIQPIAM